MKIWMKSGRWYFEDMRCIFSDLAQILLNLDQLKANIIETKNTFFGPNKSCISIKYLGIHVLPEATWEVTEVLGLGDTGKFQQSHYQLSLSACDKNDSTLEEIMIWIQGGGQGWSELETT